MAPMTHPYYDDSRTDEEWVREIMGRTGVPADEAWFILALERGDLDGDLVDVTKADPPEEA